MRTLFFLSCLLVGTGFLSGELYAQPQIDRISPYLNMGLVSKAREFIFSDQPEKAVPVLRRYLRGKDPVHVLQAKFLLSYALLQSNSYAQAAQIFHYLTANYPLLADYHRYFRARALYKLRNFEETRSLAASIDPQSVLYTDAQLLMASALRALNRVEETIQIWKNYLLKHPTGRQRGNIHFLIAEALETQAKNSKNSQTELLSQAMEHYLETTARSPLSRNAALAQKRIIALSKKFPGATSVLTPKQQFIQARFFYKTMRNEEAEKRFAVLLKNNELSTKMRCSASYFRAHSVYKQRQRDRAIPFFDAAADFCQQAKMTNFEVKSLYYGARGLVRKKDYEKAAKQFAAIEERFPTHSYADDARLRRAEAFTEAGKPDRAFKLLATLPKIYPRGDMARDALWSLAWTAYQAGKMNESMDYLDHIIKNLGRSDAYYSEGRALYWKARILSRMNKPKNASEYYERCIREYPLSYYALLAFNRLRKNNYPLFSKLKKELLNNTGEKTGRWNLSNADMLKTPNARRGIELARLGLGQLAAKELARAGLSVKKSTSKQNLWLAAVLLDKAGLWHLSHQVPRNQDRSYRYNYPLGENYRFWKISYPQAFSHLVRAHSRKNHLPPFLVWAVMREESAFSPSIESYANAIGLMQIILPTARAAAKYHKLQVDRDKLRDPAFNIRLATTYLGWLYKAFKNTAPLAVASYNAGQGATYRWLTEFHENKLDELVENIPYEQTRGYTKRVMSSLFTYSVLYKPGKRIPSVRNPIPKIVPQSF
ncbi:MAG: transglycosylase SLT domain-containing protein [Pseudomonadota bacterium]